MNRVVGHGRKGSTSTPISSRDEFIDYFRKDYWDGNVRVVLLIDEFSCLYQGDKNTQNDCLQAFRGLKHDREHVTKTRYGLLHYEYMTRRTCLLFRICLSLDPLHIMFIKRTASFSFRYPSVSPMPKSLAHTRTNPFSILAIYLVLLTATPLFRLRYGCVPLHVYKPMYCSVEP